MLPGVFCHWGYIGLGFIDLLAVVPCRKTQLSAQVHCVLLHLLPQPGSQWWSPSHVLLGNVSGWFSSISVFTFRSHFVYFLLRLIYCC